MMLMTQDYYRTRHLGGLEAQELLDANQCTYRQGHVDAETDTMARKQVGGLRAVIGKRTKASIDVICA